MYLSHLALHDFRSYERVVLSFDRGVSALVGHNGQGKTNLVEAIAFLATLSSHRTSSANALIRQGAEAAVIQARIEHEGRATTLELELYAGRANRARINRAAAKPSEIPGILRAVVFAPEDLSLVRGEPGLRRRFLDDIMIQRRPRMAKVKADYEKVLRQRGALLKTTAALVRRGGRANPQAFEVWDVQMAELGGQLMAERAAIVQSMRPWVRFYYEAIAGGAKEARIDYAPRAVRPGHELPSPEARDAAAIDAMESFEAELTNPRTCAEIIRENLSRRHDDEIERAANLVGPHRDDLSLALATFPARGYASHGESWSLALALRLASWRLLSEGGDEAILILDDVFAELDELRRERLASLAREAEQVFVTAALGSEVPESLGAQAYRVESGIVHPPTEPLAGMPANGGEATQADDGSSSAREGGSDGPQ